MTRSATAARLPWEDRWTQPTAEQLLKAVNSESRSVLAKIMRALNGYDGVTQQVVWYGPGWNWTIQYHHHATGGDATDILCYLVPKHESPVVCVPLCEHEIERLPLKRLSRIIREGVKLAKCAVTVSWATFTPGSDTDAEHLIDLIRRKHKSAAVKSSGPAKTNRRKKRTARRSTVTSGKPGDRDR